MPTSPMWKDRYLGADRRWTRELKIGDIVPYEHQVWTVKEVSERPADLVTDGRTHAVILVRGKRERHLSAGRHTYWSVFPDEHYPVCVCCSEPTPCRQQIALREAAEAAARWARYEIPGVCPACSEPVSTRQLRQTWPDNLVVPNGQPVTFHLRRQCEQEATDYDRLWRDSGRPSLLGYTGQEG